MPNPTNNVKKILTIPEGMLRRAEIGPENPNPAIKVDEYVVTTPLDTEIYKRQLLAEFGDIRSEGWNLCEMYQNCCHGQEP